MVKLRPDPIAIPLKNRVERLNERMVAGVTGLEPAASAVTGQRSNQLSYTPGETIQTRQGGIM